MQIVLSKVSPAPLYVQIEDQIRSAVYRGVVAPGDALPSIRELARDLEISLITVTRAYNDLAAEGVVGARQGRGTVVLPVDGERMQEHVTARISSGLAEAVAAARLGGWEMADLQDELERRWESALAEREER